MTITLPSIIELFGLFGIGVFFAGAVYLVIGFIAVCFIGWTWLL